MSRLPKIIILGAFLLMTGLLIEFRQKPEVQSQNETYQVEKVIDGDTLEISRYGKIEKVRLIGIDTPETLDPRKPVQCFGKEASDSAKAMLTGKRVKVDFDPIVGEKDKYGRLLAYIWDGDDLVNLRLIKEGYAHEYTYRSQKYKYQTEFKSAEMVAKESGIGLWSPQTCNGITK